MARNDKKKPKLQTNKSTAYKCHARFFFSSRFSQICVSQIKRFLSATECNHNFFSFFFHSGNFATVIEPNFAAWKKRKLRFFRSHEWGTLLHLICFFVLAALAINIFSWMIQQTVNSSLLVYFLCHFLCSIIFFSCALRQHFGFLCQHQSFSQIFVFCFQFESLYLANANVKLAFFPASMQTQTKEIIGNKKKKFHNRKSGSSLFLLWWVLLGSFWNL